MQFPNGLQYSKSHEWVQFLPGNMARVGLTDYAQDAMGDLVYVNLPEMGVELSPGQDMGEVESVKSVSNVYSPLGGKVTAINVALLDAPEKVNEDPYGAWLVEISEINGQEALLSAAEYEAFCQEGV